MKVLSICVPTYNRGKKLVKLIKILEEVNKACKENVEIIISNNGSTDGTEQMIAAYTDVFDITNQESNLGYDGNIKYLFEKANGKYVFYLADDDEIDKSRLLNLVEILSNETEEVDCYLISYDEEDAENDLLSKLSENCIYDFSALQIDFFKPFMFLSGFVIRRKIINTDLLCLGTYFMQMDIALESLNVDSKIRIIKTSIVNGKLPPIGENSGCNVSSSLWKIYIGSAKTIRKYEGKFCFDTPYFLEYSQMRHFYSYCKLNKFGNIIQIYWMIFKMYLSIRLKYKVRVLCVPIKLFKSK